MRRLLAAVLLLSPMLVHAADISVEVSGVEGNIKENVLAFLSIQQYRDKEDLTEAMIRRLHTRAPDEIRRALMAFGYYRPEVEASLQATAESWQARYVIDKGPPVTLESIDVRINGDESARKHFAEILAEPPIKRGSVLNHAEYETFKNVLLNEASQQGYLDATFGIQRLAVNTETLRAAIELELETGRRYYFGEMEINQDILDDDVIRRYAEFEPGDPLSYEKLLNLQFDLTDSEYFKNVNVDALRDQAGDERRVPIRVNADANERSRYVAGLGYGTDTGARITLGFQRRYVNRRGHKLSAEARLSELEDTYQVRYTIPLEDPARESFQLFAGTIHAERADTVSDRIVLGASRIRTLGDWEQTLYLRAEQEDSTLPNDSFRSTSLIPGASWLKTEADDLFYTRDGYKLYLDIHGSHESIGSSTEYFQAHFLGKRIIPFGEDWRLLLRAELGATALDDASLLPVSQRFFAGGDYSVRGYDYNRLGPSDENNKVVGGQYLATGGVEIEYRLAQNWAIAGFSDIGNAFDDPDAELKQSIGVGVRWISPIGVVRVDVAKPLNADEEPPYGIELHISVGPDL